MEYCWYIITFNVERVRIESDAHCLPTLLSNRDLVGSLICRWTPLPLTKGTFIPSSWSASPHHSPVQQNSKCVKCLSDMDLFTGHHEFVAIGFSQYRIPQWLFFILPPFLTSSMWSCFKLFEGIVVCPSGGRGVRPVNKVNSCPLVGYFHWMKMCDL